MIIWIASYPKSGNTYLRSFISSYYFSKNGIFKFNDLINIQQFPNIKFTKLNNESKEDASKSWIFNQNSFFVKDKTTFLKTHNCLMEYEGNKFTTENETIGGIGIVIDSWGMASLFLSNGNAQKMLNCKDNSKVIIKVSN